MIGTAQGCFHSWYVISELAKSAVGVSKKQPGRNDTFTTPS